MESLVAAVRACASPAVEWEAHEVVLLGFGLKELRIGCRLRCTRGSEQAEAEAMAEAVVTSLPQLQSVDVLSTEVDVASCGGFGDLHGVGLLEPHKRFQNSVSIFQRRRADFAEPLHSWTP